MFVVIAVIVGGFWPSYFSIWTNIPWQFHAHGIAASIWVAMVTVQSWTAHDKSQLALHRAVGKSSLFLFPFLIAGLAAILDRSAKGFVAGDGPIRVLFGPSFMLASRSRSPPTSPSITARSNIGGKYGCTPATCCRRP
jgi:hypothetical protein